MLLEGIDTVRGQPAWRAVFTISGGTLFFKVRDSTVSWFDTASLSSLRFVQHIREGRYHADRDYQIYPERATYARLDQPEVPSVHEPLDDASFLYFLRTVPLESVTPTSSIAISSPKEIPSSFGYSGESE